MRPVVNSVNTLIAWLEAVRDNHDGGELPVMIGEMVINRAGGTGIVSYPFCSLHMIDPLDAQGGTHTQIVLTADKNVMDYINSQASNAPVTPQIVLPQGNA